MSEHYRLQHANPGIDQKEKKSLHKEMFHLSEMFLTTQEADH